MQKAITIGIIGHTDHGKTSLVRCLTGIDTDSTKAEKKRGVSMQCGIAPMQTKGDFPVALIDVPGHEQFLKNTIRGLCAVDMVILVVAADDGIMPQTKAHMNLVRHLDIQYGFTVLSKTDLVDEELLELAELEVREATEDTFLNQTPVMRFSAVNQKGLSGIKICIEEIALQVSSRKPDTPFRLWIDKVRKISGIGTVACGTILSGTVSLDTPLTLLPEGRETKARTLEVHHQPVDRAVAGQRVGINLPKIPLHQVLCGMALAEPNTFVCSRFFNVTIQADLMIKNQMRVKFQVGTCSTNATVVLMQGDVMKPGETSLAQLRFKTPVSASPGDRFVMIMMNMPVVLGGGTVLEMSRQKYRAAKTSHIVPFLTAMQTRDIDGILKTYLQKYPMRVINELEIETVTGIPGKEAGRKLDAMCGHGDVLKIAKNGYCLRTCHESFLNRTVEIVQQATSKNLLRPSMNKEEIKKRLAPSIDDKLFNHLMHTLVRSNRLLKHNHLYTIPGASSFLTTEQNKLADQLIAHANSIGISPFSVGGFCKQTSISLEKNQVLKVLNHLHQEGEMVRLSKETFISPMAIRMIKQCVKKAADEKSNIHLSDCKAILGYGRSKGAVVFEYLDHIGFTLRRGDYRVLSNQHAVMSRQTDLQ